MSNDIVFNYVVTFFSILIILGFFIYNTSKVYIIRNQLSDAVNIISKICIKINYEGIILENNKSFSKLVAIEDEQVVGKELFELISIPDKDEFMQFITTLEEDHEAKFECQVTFNEHNVFLMSFKGIVYKNIYGVPINFILIGTDVTALNQKTFELQTIKEKNISLFSQIANSEEELQRNFEQLLDAKSQIVEFGNKHQILLESLPIGVFEYDFQNRQLYFSSVFHSHFIMGTHEDSISSGDFLQLMFSVMTHKSYCLFLEEFYFAFNQKLKTFSILLDLQDQPRQINLCCNIAYDKNNDFYFLSGTTSYAN